MNNACPKASATSRPTRLAGRRSGGTLTLVVVLIVLLAMVILNPSQERHEAAIKEAARKAAKKQGGWSAVGAAVGLTDLSVNIMALEYKNMTFFSTTSHDDTIRSIGVLGYVYVR